MLTIRSVICAKDIAGATAQVKSRLCHHRSLLLQALREGPDTMKTTNASSSWSECIGLDYLSPPRYLFLVKEEKWAGIVWERKDGSRRWD